MCTHLLMHAYIHNMQNIEELYQCEWLPNSEGTWYDRSASPDVLARAAKMAAAGDKREKIRLILYVCVEVF